MRRSSFTFAIVLTALLLPAACRGRGSSATGAAGESPASSLATPRRMPVVLALDSSTVRFNGEGFTFTLRLTNGARDSVRVSFMDDPPFDRELRDRVRPPVLWYTIERADVASSSGYMHLPFPVRDTVLAPGAEITVPVSHSMRVGGLNPGQYRIRGGVGIHASKWVGLRVTE